MANYGIVRADRTTALVAVEWDGKKNTISFRYDGTKVVYVGKKFGTYIPPEILNHARYEANQTMKEARGEKRSGRTDIRPQAPALRDPTTPAAQLWDDDNPYKR